MFIKLFFQEYLQIVNAFYRFAIYYFPVSINKNLRQIFNHQNCYPLILDSNMSAEFQLRRVRTTERQAIHFHEMDYVRTLLTGHHKG